MLLPPLLHRLYQSMPLKHKNNDENDDEEGKVVARRETDIAILLFCYLFWFVMVEIYLGIEPFLPSSFSLILFFLVTFYILFYIC
jgi:hypothetical protein